MKKVSIPVCLIPIYLFTILSTSFAQAPEVLWMKELGESSSNCAYAVYETPDNGFMIGGFTVNSGQRDFYMMKTDGDGNMIWDKSFGQDDRFESLRDMVQCDDGGYLLAGSRAQDEPTYKTDAYIIKTDANGNEEWSSIFGYDSISEGINGVCQTSDGGYALCGGYWATPQTVYDVLIIKTNSLGLQEWREVYSFEDGMAEHAMHIIGTDDGGLVVTGETQAFSGDWTDNAYLMKTNHIGEVLWLNTYGDLWPWYESASHFIPTSDGGFLTCGQQNNDGLDKNWYVVKTDENGSFTWSNNAVGGTYHDGAYASCEAIDGNFAVTGTYHNGTRNSFLTKYSMEGDTLWTKLWGYEGLNQYNYAIQQLNDGGYITAGSTTTDAEELKIFLTRLSPDVVGIDNNNFEGTKKVIEQIKVSPNPFNMTAIISFKLLSSNLVNINIYNILGEEILKLTDEVLLSGDHEYAFNASEFQEGLYLCRITTGNFDKIIKLNKVF